MFLGLLVVFIVLTASFWTLYYRRQKSSKVEGLVDTIFFFLGSISLAGILFSAGNTIGSFASPSYDEQVTIKSAQSQINSTYPLTLNRQDVSTLLGEPPVSVWDNRNDGEAVDRFGKVDTVLFDGTIVPIQLVRVNGKYELVTPDAGSGFHELQHKN